MKHRQIKKTHIRFFVNENSLQKQTCFIHFLQRILNMRFFIKIHIRHKSGSKMFAFMNYLARQLNANIYIQQCRHFVICRANEKRKNYEINFNIILKCFPLNIQHL